MLGTSVHMYIAARYIKEEFRNLLKDLEN